VCFVNRNVFIYIFTTINYKTYIMKHLNTFTIWLKNNKQSIELNLPFHTVQTVKDFIEDNFDKRVISISKH